MLLVTSSLRHVGSMLMLVVDASGLVTTRGLRGSVFVEACQAAQRTMARTGRRLSPLARCTPRAMRRCSSPATKTRAHASTRRGGLGVSLLNDGFPSIPMAKFSPSGWLEAAPQQSLPTEQVDGWLRSPDTLRMRASALESGLRALEQASATRSQQSSARVGEAGSPPLNPCRTS